MSGRLLTLVPFGLISLLAAAAPAAAEPYYIPDIDFIEEDLIEIDVHTMEGCVYIYVSVLPMNPYPDYGECLLGGVQGTTVPVPDDPPPGTGFSYLAGIYDETGPGSLGTDSAGTPRLPTTPCKPSRRCFDLTPDDAPDGLPTREALRNPTFESWASSREWTGVAMHSGEFSLVAVDPVGGAGKPEGIRGGGAVGTGPLRFFPGRPAGKNLGGGGGHGGCGGGGGGGAISFDVDVGIGGSIGINVVDNTTEAVIAEGATVSGGSGTLGGRSKAPVKKKKTKPDTGKESTEDPVQEKMKKSSSGPQKKAAKKKEGKEKTNESGEEPVQEKMKKSTSGPGKKAAKKKVSWMERRLDPMIERTLSRLSRLERTYRSRIEHDGPLGHGWDFTANSRLVPDGPDVAWLDGTGRRFVFHRMSPTEFVSPMGCYARLFEDPSGFLLRFPDGRIRTYNLFDGSNTQGALESEVDPGGSRIGLLYDHQGLLTTIVDDLGRSLTLSYNTDGRIDAATDFAGRTVEYGYDPNGNLVSVRSPVVTGTPNGNDFPQGKTTLYSYTSGHPDSRFNHNLETITSPRETGSAIPFLVNTYEPDPNDFAFDGVTAQLIGGTGSDGIPTGGPLAYSYVPLNLGGDPFDMALPRREVTVLDRNGNERVWLVNAAGNPIALTEKTNRGLRPGEPDYTTQAGYNNEGELVSLLPPEGNEVVLTYDRPGTDRYREGDLLEARLVPDPISSGGRGDGRGIDLPDIVWSFEHEPVGHNLMRAIDPQGRETTWTFDYQEGDPNISGIQALATQFMIDISGVPFNLGDLNADVSTLQAAGHVVRVDRPTVSLDPGSNQAAIEGDTTQEIVTLLTWNDHGQLTSVLDPEGNLHVLTYNPESDPDGDGSPTPAPQDGRLLDPAEGGYLANVTLDVLSAPGRNNDTNPAPAAVELDYEYDPLGRRIGLVNERGVRTSRVYNQLDQVVELQRASATGDAAGCGGTATGRGEPGLTAWCFRERFFYDENDNLAEHHVEESGASTGAGPWIETIWTHELLDNPTSQEQEVDAVKTLTTSFEYDANENLVHLTHPAATEDELQYDERDLLLSSTRGAAGPRGGTPTARQYEYDGNRNLTRLTDGRGGLIDWEYDGADRDVRWIDQVGSRVESYYDPSGNITGIDFLGPTGGATPPDRTGATNTILAFSTYEYDPLDRLIKMEKWLDVSSGPPPVRTPVLLEGPLDPNDWMIDQVYEYDRLSRRSFFLADRGTTTRYDYDGAGRLLQLTGPAGDTQEWTWDGSGNPVERVETELPSLPGPPPEVFLTTWLYDSLDRTTTAVDNVGQTYRWTYDSFDRVQVETDPMGPAGGTIDRRSPAWAGTTVGVNAHGNVTDYDYDAAGRLLWVRKILTATGAGDGTLSPTPAPTPANPDGLVTLGTTWDDNSVPDSRVDDKGNTTTYAYDNLDRRTAVTADDGTSWSYVYDGEGNVDWLQDPNGNEFNRSLDPANRVTEINVTPAPGIPGSTYQAFEYDGLSRLTLAFDNNESMDPNDDTVVEFTYDTLGRILEEHQIVGGGPVSTTSHGWLAEDLRTEITTPSSLQVDYSYDPAGRLLTVDAAPSQAVFQYFGMDRVHTRVYANGVRSTMLDDAGTTDIGYDSTRRIALLRHLDPNNNLLAGFEYDHDRNGLRTSRMRLHVQNPAQVMGDLDSYDSTGRLVSWQEVLVDPNLPPGWPPAQTWIWELDGAGNWVSHEIDGTAFSETPNNNNEYDEPQSGGTRVDDGIPDDCADMQATVPADGINLRHDMSGHQIFDGTHDLLFDAFGRLVLAGDPNLGLQVLASTYDALGRRVTRTVINRGSLDEVRRYLYAGTTVVEELDGAGVLARTAVFGRHGRDLLWQIDGGGTVHYYLQDAHGSTVAMTDGAAPAVMERVTYGPYGWPRFADPNSVPLIDPNSGLPMPRSTVGNPSLFAGMRYEPELGGCPGGGWGPECGGTYHTLHRTYSPFQGRFLSRDPLGVWADPAATGNGYVYAGGDPINRSDPLGLGPGDDPVTDLPAGPFLRLEDLDLDLDVFGQTLSGNFVFERVGPEKPKPFGPEPWTPPLEDVFDLDFGVDLESAGFTLSGDITLQAGVSIDVQIGIDLQPLVNPVPFSKDSGTATLKDGSREK
jgi:RHS repeat-associated protein